MYFNLNEDGYIYLDCKIVMALLSLIILKK